MPVYKKLPYALQLHADLSASGARFRRNVNEARFCDASHITRYWTYANPYDLIDATEPFGSALANRFLTLGLFCFCLPTM